MHDPSATSAFATATDAQLLHAWREGDARAGSDLIRRHARRLYEFFASKVCSGAEDLCQQTLAACVESRERIEEDGCSRTFRSYMFAVARSKLINYYRHLDRHDRRFDPLRTTAAQRSGGLSELVARRADRRRLREALRRLPVDAQIVLELHYWDQLRVREIAAVLDVPEGTVKARLSRARRHLQQRLAAG
jgi:RNA polymerase sigma-70 factor (ECF subfamily)